MYLEIFLADFAVFRVFWGISRVHDRTKYQKPWWTDPEGDSRFSIYQISWIKIKKELFVNKSFTAKILSFKTVVKREAILNPAPKQWISKGILSYWNQSKCAKTAIHWFGEY